VVSIFKATVLFREWIITMLDERFVRLRTHRDNIARYQGILKTDLTDLERQFIERRLSEEQSEFELLQTASRVTAKVQNGPAHLAGTD
jgi:hypothetical protein